MGLKLVGPVLYTYGTQAQKDHYLPRLRTAEHVWAQGFSEPGSGSDLARLRTRAARDGDNYVVSGHTIWTTQDRKSGLKGQRVYVRFNLEGRRSSKKKTT